ncbi:acyl-CoA dehydrogenase family protein [Candidatus Phycosocius spiralis]|uniref:Acyl-CoA dehydrogenase n=1 Tax=Candidatus Phycosocius spiralis TaxID=2815099 RepID=A0ABQ4PSS3_9PROT|nr:acyl-CoA dehydrogenase family protein [Candidatus Phycosocius spiralis]GIU66043.1 acyl-CoA dehydrogenase [Candidatus Phycosocius spiralis]
MTGFVQSDEHRAIEEAVARICSKYDDAFWLHTDESGQFPEAFVSDMANGGWLGCAFPETYGGAGLGLVEAALVMKTVAQSGAGFSGASAIHLNIFGPKPIEKFGTLAQKQAYLPKLITGEHKMCFAVTEPNAGLETAAITTRATRTSNGYTITGRKIWTTCAQRADKILLLARTTPREETTRPTDGLSLFYCDFDRSAIDAKPIPKMGRKAVECNMLFIEDLEVPHEALIGEEGKGFKYILSGLNPERVLFGVEAIGLGRAALTRATQYAKERVVFGRPIGMNQGLAHPLAKAWCELEAAELMAMKAATLFDAELECGAEANAAKYLGAEAGYHACETSLLVHGGMGYAKEYHVERMFRESMIARIAPVSREMILNFVAERVLGLPKSY